jgi:hypothetical protein
MKKIIITTAAFLIIFLSSGDIFSQRFEDFPPPSPQAKEMKKLIKEKLMEKLQVNETTANRFIEISDNNMQKMRSLNKEKRELMISMEKEIDSPDLNRKLERFMEIDSEMNTQRQQYINDLKEIFSTKQIVQSIILQRNFMKEFRKEMDKHRKPRERRN